MGYAELLRVIEEEAAREVREVRSAGEREAARILAEARAAAEAARDALLGRVRAEEAARARAAQEALARERERALLVARRGHLDALRAEAEGALAAAGGPELDGRLLAELILEAGTGPIELEVDPGAEEACRAALARLAPEAAAQARVVAAPARRGGVRLVAGRRVLDDTLPARLARAWPEVEGELAALLFAEEGAWPGSIA